MLSPRAAEQFVHQARAREHQFVSGRAGVKQIFKAGVGALEQPSKGSEGINARQIALESGSFAVDPAPSRFLGG